MNHHPRCVQHWYDDDAGSVGDFDGIELFFEDLVKIGPDFGYFPEPSKSVLIVCSPNLLRSCSFFNELRRREF